MTSAVMSDVKKFITLNKSRNGAELESDSKPNPEVILMFTARQESSKKIGVRALIDMCATGKCTKIPPCLTH